MIETLETDKAIKFVLLSSITFRNWVEMLILKPIVLFLQRVLSWKLLLI